MITTALQIMFYTMFVEGEILSVDILTVIHGVFSLVFRGCFSDEHKGS